MMMLGVNKDASDTYSILGGDFKAIKVTGEDGKVLLIDDTSIKVCDFNDNTYAKIKVRQTIKWRGV